MNIVLPADFVYRMSCKMTRKEIDKIRLMQKLGCTFDPKIAKKNTCKKCSHQGTCPNPDWRPATIIRLKTEYGRTFLFCFNFEKNDQKRN